MKRIDKILMRFVVGLLALPAFMVSCSDDPLPENYYTFTGEMVSDYLQNRPEEFSEFIAILQRSGMYGMMATYGSYTCLAPNNAAVEAYLHSRGLTSVDQLTKEECDTISWNHIIDDDAYFTTDLIDGNIPSPNMNGRNLTFSCDSNEMNNNNVIYYINKSARMIVWDDSVENGVVHTLDKVVVPQTFYLPDVLRDNPEISLFYEALMLTHLNDSLMEYIDPDYTCGADSVNIGFRIHTGGNENGYEVRYVGTRMKRYSAFVETNAVFAQNGINNLDDLKARAKQTYDRMFPEDAGKYDDDWTHRKNPLNRFIAYHLLPYYGAYNDWTLSGDVKTKCAQMHLIDCTDWYTTLMPGTLMKFSSPQEGLYINRKGVGPVFSVRGVKVLSPSEMTSEVDQQALNGIYHYIDEILEYDEEMRDQVCNDRIRIDVATLSPEFMNCGARGNTIRATGFKEVEGWDFHGSVPTMTLRQRTTFMVTYPDCVDMIGPFDLTFKLPPVPTTNTYEVRFAYGVASMRGVVQIYFGTDPNNLRPVGLPIDFRVGGPDPTIGWVADTGDPEIDRAIDKAMHSRGYMKEMDSWKASGVDILRDFGGGSKLRKILATETMDPGTDYYIRIKQVLDNPEAELPINYFEIVPKSIYAGVVAEDTH